MSAEPNQLEITRSVRCDAPVRSGVDDPLMLLPENRPPRIGERAPSFEAKSTQGRIRFPDNFRGRWVVFFSHAADFTPVCTTEFMMFASLQPEFKRLNCQLLGLSADSTDRHIAWLRAIEERIAYRNLKSVTVDFPVISDADSRVARTYGIYRPGAESAVRAVFIIDPAGIVRAMLQYPATNGRNVPEIRRLLLALQLSDRHQVATPANWQPGEDVIVPAADRCRAKPQTFENPFEDVQYVDWLVPLTQCPE